MAYDDICQCSTNEHLHTKREHNYVGVCEYAITTRVQIAGGFFENVVTKADCDCVKFTDRFAIPESSDADGNAVEATEGAVSPVADFMATLKMEMAELALIMAPIKADLDGVMATLEELDNQKKAAIIAKNSIEAKMKNFNTVMDKAKRAAELAERKLDQEAAIAQAEAEFLRLADSYDLLTADAPWREWAFKYQIEDAKRMALSKRNEHSRGGCIVGNKMGTGKTLTSFIALDMLNVKRVLYFTPATVVRTAAKEAKHWAPHRNVVIMAGMAKDVRRSTVTMLQMVKEAGENFVVIINYEAMRKDGAFIEELKTLEFDVVILDEAHNFKDKKSLTFRQIKEICNGDGHQPAYVFPMTGSPILNKPQDLWPLLNLVAPYDFASENYFLSGYCRQDWETKKWTFTPTGLAGLQRNLRDKFISRTKEQTGIQLPEKTITVHDIDLDPVANAAQYRAYNELRTSAAIWLDEDRALSVTTALALITRERQMMTMPSGIKWADNDEKSPTFGEVIFKCDIDDSVKIDYIIHANGNGDKPSFFDPGGLSADLIEEKQVIMSQFKAPLHELKRRFDECVRMGNPEYACEIIDGDTPMDRRQEYIDDFQSDTGRIRILIGNFKALGVGVTLHAASQMIILDEEWSPGKNEQAYDRIHRIGQSKAVTIHILRVTNSIDDWMAMINEEKAKLVDGFSSSMDIAQEYRKRLLGGTDAV